MFMKEREISNMKHVKTLFRKCRMQEHMKTHQEGYLQLRMPCDQCEKSFKTKLQLKEHIMSKHENRAFASDLCERTYKMKQNLTDHRNRVHLKVYLGYP